MSQSNHIFASDVESIPAGRGAGFADELPHAELAEAFPVYEPTDAELEAEYQRCAAGRRPADWQDVPCERCQATVTVAPGARQACTKCQRAHVAKVASKLCSETLAGVLANPASTQVDAEPGIVAEVYAAELMRRQRQTSAA